MKKGSTLNPKQKAFVAEYLKDKNATQAAIRAGYSKSNADKIGPGLLGKNRVYAAILEALKEQEKRTLVDADYVITGLKEVAERCLERAPVMVREGREMVQKTRQETCPCGCGNKFLADVWEFDSMGANKAFELLGRHLKMFTDKVDLTSGGATLKDLLTALEDKE